MEPRCGPRAGRPSPQHPQTPARARALALAHAGLLLLLLLPPPPPSAGCLGAGQASGALSMAAPAKPDAPCAPNATCPSGGHRLRRQASTSPPPPTSPPPTTSPSPTASPPPTTSPSPTASPLPTTSPQPRTSPPPTASPPPTTTPQAKTTLQYSASKAADDDLLPACGFSYELDPTLRDPEAMARRWPWMVSVRANGIHVCAGTLIASHWVLTVAHCMTQSDVTYSVRAGSPQIDQVSKTTVDVLAQQVIMNRHYRSHRYWSWIGRANDIALLKLERPLKYNKYVWPICLPGLDYEVKDHTLCTVTGWGLPRLDGVWPQFRTIQEKEVTILNSTECDSLYHRFSKIPSLIQIINSQMICAKDVDREQFCYELSGEPLACPVERIWYLVGMVSWGPGCKKSEFPPVYLHISSYQQWIWERLNGQTLPAPSRVLLVALLLPLSLLAVL